MVSLATALGLCSKSPFPNHQSKEKMALRQLISFNRTAFSSTPSHLAPGFANFSSKSTPYIVKVGIPEFLNGVGKGVETHVEKLESEIGDIQKLLVTPALLNSSSPFLVLVVFVVLMMRKLILKFAHKYRVGLWRPQAQPVKS
ncbi:hypothetical protein RHGRI_031953 [Rhododendron griersonianum]|uniref:Small ribosomal subunit protein mS41 SAM domain-containing protein n=1 Tax=Rhododendron griersonianum TaxID=479676 RepID=A0AAV6IC92_9ERIC|nr:hypothetical protein RHGRI_031953 [Rhododendron griersonianum]